MAEKTQLDKLQEQVAALAGALAERDKEAGRMIEAIAHHAARAFNLEFMLQMRTNAGRGVESLRFAPGLAGDTYKMIYDEVVAALRLPAEKK